MLAITQLMAPLLAKHGIKSARVWNDLGVHTICQVYETPGLDAFWALLNEPELAGWLSFSTVENRVVIGREEVEAILGRMEDGAVVVRPSYRAGDLVRIGTGPLEGLEAIFEREMPDQDRVVLLLRSLSYQARIVVDLAEVVNL